MYIIIGGDGKEYGPVSGEDLRQWISEGRLNAQSLAKAESDAEFRPLTTFPELANAFGTSAPAAFPAATGWNARDYDLDIGGCVSRGWNLFKENMGTLLGSFLLGMVILVTASMMLSGVLTFLIPKTLMQSVVFRQFFNVALQAVLALVNGPLFGGIFYVYIQTLRGRPTSVGEIFIGFQRAFSQLYLANLIVAFFIGLCLVPFNIMQAEKMQPLLEQLQHAGSAQNPQEIFSQMMSTFFGVLPVLCLCMIPLTYLTINWQFTLPLIIDKGMDFWTAMKTSWKMVHKHWFHLFGLTVVVGLINMAGLAVCCIGILFAAPVGFAAMMCAYETIFGESQTH